MPIIDILLLEGRSQEQKQKLVEKITDAAEEALGAPRDSVQIILREVPKHHFAVGGVFKGPGALLNDRPNLPLRMHKTAMQAALSATRGCARSWPPSKAVTAA